MLFPDLTLARRLEFHEAWSSGEHARIQAQLYPETGAVSQPIAEGCAVFCGKKSPLSQVYGWGLSGPVLATDLDEIETFYRSRELRPRVRVCPLADPSLLQLLGERAYIVQDHMNIYAYQVDARGDDLPSPPDLRIQIATPEDARLWFEQDDAGGDWVEPDGRAFMTIRCVLKSDTRLFLAWRDGQLVSSGALETHAGVAALMAAGTIPAFRNQGIHTALLHTRLAAAVEASCDLAMGKRQPNPTLTAMIFQGGGLQWVGSVVFGFARCQGGRIWPRASRSSGCH